MKTELSDADILRAHTVEVLTADGTVIGCAPAAMHVDDLVVEMDHQLAIGAAFLRLLDANGAVIAVAPARAHPHPLQ